MVSASCAFCPPDSAPTRCFSGMPRPSSLETARSWSQRTFRFLPTLSMSRTGRFWYSGASWATKAVRSRAARDPAVSPATTTVPAVGRIMPTARLSRVVLPDPFGPTRPVTHPAGTDSVQSRRPHFRPYRFPRPTASITSMTGPLPGVSRTALCS